MAPKNFRETLKNDKPMCIYSNKNTGSILPTVFIYMYLAS